MSIKKIIYLVALCMSYAMHSQTTITGIIKDKETQEVLPGAILYFPDLKSSSVSKTDGSFEIHNLPSIKTLLQVRLLGYQTIIRTIDLSSTSSIIIEMEQSHIEANEVVVTGVSKATEIKRNPVPMVSIDQQYLEQNTATNVIDAMAKVPGVNVLSTGPNVSKPYIRGLGYNRVLTLFDGVRQESQQWGDEHGIEVDQFLINRIEVIKGPASLIYGSDALAGVVNLLPENTAPEGTIKGSVQVNYQTNNGLYAASGALAGNIKSVVFGLRASYKEATNFQNKYDGRVHNTGFKENDLNAYIGLNRKWGYSHLNFSIYDNLQEIPDGSRDSLTRKFTKQITEEDTIRPIVSDSELSSYTIDPIHQHVQHYRLFSTNQFILGESKLALKLGYQQSIRREFAHPENPDIPGLYLDMKTATYDLKFYAPELKGWESTIGLNGMYQKNNVDKGTEFVIPEYSLLDFAPFLYIKKEIKKIDLAFGARYDIRSFHNTELYTNTNPATGFDMKVTDTIGAIKQFNNYDHTFKGFSGSVGITYNISERLLIKGNIAKGFRAPNISEISAKGVHPGSGFQQLGDDNFKPETNLQEDIGIFFDSHHVSLSAEVFNNMIDHYIFNQKLQNLNGGDSLYIEAGNSYPVYKFRQTKAQLFGGEARIDIHPHPLDWLHFENSVSMVYGINKGGNGAELNDSNKYLPFIPPLHTNSELRAELPKKISCFHHLYFKIGMQYYAAQNMAFLADNTETKTPGYTLFDAGIGTDICTKKEITLCTIGIFVTNLSDVAYQSNMSRLKYFDNYPNNGTGRSGIYSMGRNISFKLTIPFNIKSSK
ncbi:MAG: TonB-dependent receptor [Bacteroidetes bacterium]|jgi:iron complex outermembrane receptor protein|nr:TonB-dependent receptor [Bacteroidota bacterium]MDF2453003.1 TonB-dependent receptor [Bacteroidota bacterium]